MDSVEQLVETARQFYHHGWLLGTSGNLSHRISSEPLRFYITSSGRHKGGLHPHQILCIGPHGVEGGEGRPSAETAIHERLYRTFPNIGAVYHVHTVKSAVVSMHETVAALPFQGLEMIKGFDIWEPDAAIELPLVENHPHIPDLAEAVVQGVRPRVPGVVVRGHGIYAWGDTPHAARRHVEVIEYLCDYHYAARLLA